MRRRIKTLVVALWVSLLIMPFAVVPAQTVSDEPITPQDIPVVEVQKEVVYDVIDIPEPSRSEIRMSESDINLIALVTMAEAENQCEEGKRLVIDTVLNRVDHERFPGTVYDVIYQTNQFTSMWDGRVDRCYVKEDIRQLVIEEATSRTNHEVVFFRGGRYSSYGVPFAKVGDHYFSTL